MIEDNNMKIKQLKQEVYGLTFTKSTKQLKKSKPELLKGKDLRLKESWVSIYSTLILIDNFQQEQTKKTIAKEYRFKPLDKTYTFQDLLDNIKSLGELFNSLEEKLDNLNIKKIEQFGE